MTLQERAHSLLRARFAIDPKMNQLVRDLLDEIEYLNARLEGVQLERDIYHVVARRERMEAGKA